MGGTRSTNGRAAGILSSLFRLHSLEAGDRKCGIRVAVGPVVYVCMWVGVPVHHSERPARQEISK